MAFHPKGASQGGVLRLLPRRDRWGLAIALGLLAIVAIHGCHRLAMAMAPRAGWEIESLTDSLTALAIGTIAGFIIFFPVAALAIALLARYRWSALMQAMGRCKACLHDVRGLRVAPDGCTVCPECGAAWRLPEESSKAAEQQSSK